LLYLQCESGASGDMLAGALLGLCAPEGAPGGAAAAFDRVVAPALAAAGIDPAVVHVAGGVSGGLAAQRFTVDDLPGFATFAELVAAVRGSTLDRAMADGVVAVAERMAAAERAVHGAGGGEHLHELAGLDTAVDLISALALVAELDPARIVASPPVLGGGTVTTAHGELPVPTPAVIELLRGLPTGGAGPAGQAAELTTPTGAALLAHLVDEFGALPPGRLCGSGLGAGLRELPGRANVLRALLIAPLDRTPGDGGGPWAEDDAELLETTIDDLPAELLAEAAARLLAAGALDVWSTPATMKKSRPGVVLHVLARPADRAALAEIAFTETSTFGLRVTAVRRLLLDERRATVTVAGEAVRVRLGFLGERLVTASPEYEDCRRAAARAGRPTKDLYDEARAAARGLGAA
jgi:pyridinium-3,5-bisthiocarboxylic acid mononucleotide nickel chelatase